MLKIKDNIDLNSLVIFGFHSYKVTRNITNWYRCFAWGCCVIIIAPNRNIIIDTLRKGDERLHKQPKCHYKDRTSYDEVLYDLITAGIVEKAPLNENNKQLIETRGTLWQDV